MSENTLMQTSPDGDDPFVIESVAEIETKSAAKVNKISYDPSASLSFEEVRELDHKYILQTYNRIPKAFQYGSGEILYDSEGKEYIDFLTGIAVNALGHAHADIVAGLNRQADLLWHTSNLFYNQQQAMLARAVVEINFPGKVFFCNSGTEANEAALKFIKARGQKQSPKKNSVLALKNGFHGRSFGSVSITGQQKIQDGFGELLTDVTFVEPNNIEELQNAMNEDICGIFIEPIQGEGGVLPMTKEFLAAARDLCNKYDALLVFDEIQTGMGRTGHYFAYQGYGVTPDLLTMAKGLGGGFPIGGLLVSEKYSTSGFTAGMHGSTFGGNHLACAVAYEVIRTIESSNVLENVNKMHTIFVEKLNELMKKYPKLIKDIRGKGLLLGLVMREDIDARKVLAQALDKGLVIARAGTNVLRFLPPLNVRQITIERAIEKLDQLLQEMS